MLELKRLEEEPLCHRLAAQLLMNTCRGLQNVNEENLQVTKSRLQRNHVESFAAALTICDMEDVKMAVPETCRPLSSSALFQAVRDNMDILVVPAEVVGACLTSLSEQEKPWMTWLSRRDTALLFCRASSIDMDNGMEISKVQPPSTNHFLRSVVPITQEARPNHGRLFNWVKSRIEGYDGQYGSSGARGRFLFRRFQESDGADEV